MATVSAQSLSLVDGVTPGRVTEARLMSVVFVRNVTYMPNLN